VCSGCCYAPVYDNQGNEVDNQKCPFCRAPHVIGDEFLERLMKRVELDDANAIYTLGYYYREGMYGLPQDYAKALELYHRTGELGCSEAYSNIGYAYQNGEGVDVDKKKAVHNFELAAMAGDVEARHNLGIKEARHAGNFDRAVRHFMISARDGKSDSVKCIQDMYSDGQATKDDYTKALKLYQSYLGEIKSDQRDKAATADEENRYY